MEHDVHVPPSGDLRLLYLAKLEVRLTSFQQIAGRVQRGTARLEDYDTLEQEAHKLNGTAASYGLPSLSVLAERLESALHSGERGAREISALLGPLISGIEEALAAEQQKPAPAQARTRDRPAQSHHSYGFHPRVLVVDDDDAVADLVQAALGDFTDVHCVESGMAAIEAMRAARYDVVLLDHNLPDINGLEILLRARQQIHATETAVIMMTAVREATQVARLLRAGARGYVVKPFTQHTLVERVTSVMKHQAPVALVADDDPLIRELLRRNLNQRGVRVLMASNSAEALELTRSARPHLLILDRTMPREDGLEVLLALRKDPSTASLSVVILSAKRTESDISEGFHCGADDYIAKPFILTDVIDRCMSYLRPVESTAA